MVIGGIAVIARGVRRFTADIAAAIRGDEITIDQLLAALARPARKTRPRATSRKSTKKPTRKSKR
jgi:hypothetical protein